MARRKIIRKNSGTGASQLPIRRSFARELKQEPKYKDRSQVKPEDRITDKEVMELTTNRREQRLAEMDREIALNELKNDEVRLSKARSLNERAEDYMAAHGTNYTTALREVARLSESGAAEPSVAEVERYMKAHSIEDFGQAVRALTADQRDHAQAFGTASIGGVNIEQENSELEKAMKERDTSLTSIEQRALDLIEREDREAERRQEQRDQEAHESRLKDAQRRIQELDRKAEPERRQAEALVEAEKLEPEIIEKRREADDALASLMRAITEVEKLDERCCSLLREAGEPVPQPIRRELAWWLYSHLGDRAELDREQKARLTLRGEPAPFPLASEGQSKAG